MDVRPARLADLDALESLWMEMARYHQELDPYFRIVPEAEANHRVYTTGLLRDESKRILVAEDRGRLLGYVMAEVHAYPPIFVHRSYGHIGAISVTEAARRQGIGRVLVDAALAWFRALGLSRVECSVAAENPVSRGFWQGMGFRVAMERQVLEL